MLKYYLQLGWRSLRQTPGNTLLMVLAVTIGIGVSMTMLSLYHVMSAVPLTDKAEQLFAVQLKSYDNNQTTWGGMPDGMPTQISYPDAINLIKARPDIKQTAMYRTASAVYTEARNTEPQLEGIRLTNQAFFSMFNVPFLYGSVWDKKIDQQPAYQVVIGNKLNTQLFGGGNNVGKNIVLNEKNYQIVGIIADWQVRPLFYNVQNGAFRKTAQIFLPMSLAEIEGYRIFGNVSSWKFENVRSVQDRMHSESHWISFWVELPDAQSKQSYQQFLRDYISEQNKLGRFERNDARADIKSISQWLSYHQVVDNDNRILLGLSFLLLAVCLVNTISLLLAKFLRRAPMVGVRRALGASRWQIFYQHLVEVALIGLFGGVLGLLLAQLGLWWLKTNFSFYQSVAEMDWLMYLSAPLLAISSCVLAGMLPAYQVCRIAPANYLKAQ